MMNNKKIKDKVDFPVTVLIILLGLILLYLYPYLGSYKLSNNQSDWGSFGSYISGITTLAVLIIAIRKANEWLDQKVFDERMKIIELSQRIYTETIIIIEFMKALSAEKERYNKVEKRYINKMKELKKGYIESYITLNSSLIPVQNLDKKTNYDSGKNILNHMWAVSGSCDIKNINMKELDKERENMVKVIEKFISEIIKEEYKGLELAYEQLGTIYQKIEDF